MKTEYLKEESCLQRDSTEYEEYAEALSIYLPEDMERGRELQSEHLMEMAVSPKNMEIAMKRVRANNGAPGADGKTVRETIEWMSDHYAEVQAEMMGGYYHPTAVRRRVIPKPDGGERKLGIPTAKDRIVQQAIAQILVPLYEPQFSDNSFGYRPGRSGQQAIERVKEYEARESAEVVAFGELMKTRISFYVDRTFVNDYQMENIRIVADFLKKHPEVNLIVRGYCGASSKTESPDMHLAERRVASVKKALVKYYGVDSSRFETWYDEETQAPFPMKGEWIDGVVFEMVRN